MRRLSLLLASAGLLIGDTLVYHLEPSTGSRFTLTVEKTGLLSGKKQLFVFERYKGTLVYDRDVPEHSRVELVIDAASAVCKDTWVSEKDRKKIQDYELHGMLALAVQTYPELQFTSTGVVYKGENSLRCCGHADNSRHLRARHRVHHCGEGLFRALPRLQVSHWCG